jgi:ABC-type nitrate/sulfonate/bicarbonate transport system substrate-binding protein
MGDDMTCPCDFCTAYRASLPPDTPEDVQRRLAAVEEAMRWVREAQK